MPVDLGVNGWLHFCMSSASVIDSLLLGKHKNTPDHILHTIIELESILAQIPDYARRHAIAINLAENEAHHESVISSRTNNKLNRLYKGTLSFLNANRTHISLSDTELSADQNTILSLGIKCHYKPKFDILKKQVELETLYDTLFNMHKQGTIHMNPNLKDLLRAEATKQRDFSNYNRTQTRSITRNILNNMNTAAHHTQPTNTLSPQLTPPTSTANLNNTTMLTPLHVYPPNPLPIPKNLLSTKSSTRTSSLKHIKLIDALSGRSNNVKCSITIDILQFIPYYRSNTITKLITKNNQGPRTPPLKKTNVIYQYKCSHGDCEHLNNTYIGMTTTTFSRRLTMHLASRGPKQHA